MGWVAQGKVVRRPRVSRALVSRHFDEVIDNRAIFFFMPGQSECNTSRNAAKRNNTGGKWLSHLDSQCSSS